MDDYEYEGYASKAEKRRQTRRMLEKGAASSEPDRIQMNDIMLGALVLIAAVMSFTDFSFSLGDIRKFTALTIFLYWISLFCYRNRYAKGLARGKRDPEYITSLSMYREKRQGIYDRKLASQVPTFCTYYKRQELREYRESLLCDIEISYDEYREKYLRMSYGDIMKLNISREAKKTLLKCNAAKPLRLSPNMILFEDGESSRKKLFGKSGKERERSDKKKQAISRAVYVIAGALVVFDVVFNFSIATVLQWIVRMLPIAVAIISGEDGGYCNATVTQVFFRNNQIHAIALFDEYIENEKNGEADSSPQNF